VSYHGASLTIFIDRHQARTPNGVPWRRIVSLQESPGSMGPIPEVGAIQVGQRFDKQQSRSRPGGVGDTVEPEAASVWAGKATRER